jgi:hypothetical protein
MRKLFVGVALLGLLTLVSGCGHCHHHSHGAKATHSHSCCK